MSPSTHVTTAPVSCTYSLVAAVALVFRSAMQARSGIFSNVVEATALFSLPATVAMAFTVVVSLMVNGAVYTVEAVVGSEPSVV